MFYGGEKTGSRLARALWIEIVSQARDYLNAQSRLARALWIEMVNVIKKIVAHLSRLARALWIEMGFSYIFRPERLMSRLARALWIEIESAYPFYPWWYSRGSREPCGLKFLGQAVQNSLGKGRGSREPCGLKYTDG